MNIGLILSGGTGTRFGGDIPKQYRKLLGKEVIDYVLDALFETQKINKIIVVSQDEFAKQIRSRYPVETVDCGSTRNKSLKNGLNYIKERYTCEKIIILEAARPMVTSKIIEGYLDKLDNYDSVITGQKIVDSLGSFSNHVTIREDYYLIQAPEAFNFNMLFDHFDESSQISATNQQMPKGSRLYINFDFKDNYKITYQQDLVYVGELIKQRAKNNV